MTGNGRPLDDRADQRGATARDEDVDEAARGHQVLDRLAARPRHQLRPRRPAARRRERVPHHVDQGRVRVVRRRRPAQQRRVAALQAQAGRVDRDVGPGLVDDPDDAERHAHLAHGRGRSGGCSHGRPRRPGRAARRRRGPRRRWRRSRSGVSVRRSTIAGRCPGPRPRPRRPRWPSMIRSVASSSASAMASSAASFVARGSGARVTAACATAARHVERRPCGRREVGWVTPRE